jgi:hypothetical protein
MSTINDGGPAFPSDPFVEHPTHGRIHRTSIGDEGHPGLTIRDHFAGQALVGLLAEDSSEGSVVTGLGLKLRGSPADLFANAAYELADAMLRRRAR